MLWAKMENSLIAGSYLHGLYWQPKRSKNIVCVWAQNRAMWTNALNYLYSFLFRSSLAWVVYLIAMELTKHVEVLYVWIKVLIIARHPRWFAFNTLYLNLLILWVIFYYTGSLIVMQYGWISQMGEETWCFNISISLIREKKLHFLNIKSYKYH